MRIRRVPQPDAISRNLQGEPRREIEIGADLGLRDLAVVVGQDRADLPAGLVRRHRHGEVEAGAGHVRGDPRAPEMHRRNGFQPDGLPDPGRPRVVATTVEVVRRLLAARLNAVPAVTRTYDDQRFLTGPGDFAQVRAERREPAAVPHHLDAVDPHRRVVVDGLEVQYGVLALPLGRDRDGRPIPDGFQEVDVLDPRQLRLRRKRYDDPLRQLTIPHPTLEPGVRPIDLEPPLPIQVQPLRPNKLRTRILRPRKSHHNLHEVQTRRSARHYNVEIDRATDAHELFGGR